MIVKILIHFIGIFNLKLDKLLDKLFGGNISFWNITIYGRNAMHWSVNIYTKKYGYICFGLPIPIHGKFNKKLYFSPNGTTWASTYYLYGGDFDEISKSKLRKESFGHNFNTHDHWDDLIYINDNNKLPKHIVRNNQIDDILNN